jgi:two-component system response regulator PrrA
VLIVDDDLAIITALERGLRVEGFAVRTALGGMAALREVELRSPDVMVLDINMPDLDGVSVTRMLRANGEDVPICVLSANDEVSHRVAGLEAGADDYMVKPFALPELVARLRALLRRTGAAAEGAGGMIEVGDLVVDRARRIAWRGEREMELTRREFDLLVVLARNDGIVLSRAQLLERAWGYDFEIDSNVVDVFVGYVRRKLETEGESRLIKTVRGVGFVLRS